MLKRCNKCGALLKVLKDCNCDNCGITCCGETLQKIKPNSVDASFEKHIPEYQIDGEMLASNVCHPNTDLDTVMMLIYTLIYAFEQSWDVT